MNGVRGVHNIIISKVDNSRSIDVSLHIQVKRSATLAEAHSIANALEDSIKRQLKGVGNITVHLEPLMPEVSGMEPLADNTIHESIRNTILGSASGVKKVDRIGAYKTDENILKIDVNCSFSSEMTIEQIHERDTDNEKQLLVNYQHSIVTINSQPS